MNRIIKLGATLLVAVALATPILWASDSLPFVWFQANGQPGVQLDTSGNIKQYVVGATVQTSGLALPTGNSTFTIVNSSAAVIGGVGQDGFPRFNSNAFGRITGSGASSYTVTFTTAAADTNYKVFLTGNGTSTATASTLYVGTVTTTGFIVTPSAAAAFAAGSNIDWFVIRTN